jgi:REP element-mobilizing transposase RayT
MPYDPDNHDRQSIRLRGFDYTRAAAYFVTLCAHERRCLFGDIAQDQMHLNDRGQIVAEEWDRSEAMRDELVLDAFVVMPNHVHGIAVIAPPGADAPADPRGYRLDGGATRTVGTTGRSSLPGKSPFQPGPPPKSLGSFVAGFKAAVTGCINRQRGTPGESVWQRNYYDRVLRDEDEWRGARRYVARNPARWRADRNHPTQL